MRRFFVVVLFNSTQNNDFCPKTDLSLYTLYIKFLWVRHVLYVWFEHVHHAIKKKLHINLLLFQMAESIKCSISSTRKTISMIVRIYEWFVFFVVITSKHKQHQTSDTQSRKWLVKHIHDFLENKHLNSRTCCFVFRNRKLARLARSLAPRRRFHFQAYC